MELKGHKMRVLLKTNAKKSIKSHYWMMLVICLIMAMVNIDYSDSISLIKTNLFSKDAGSSSNIYTDIIDFFKNNEAKEEQEAQKQEENQNANPENASSASAENESASADRNIGIISVEHSRGVLAKLANFISVKNITGTLYSSVNSIIGSKNVLKALMIGGALAWSLFVSFCLVNVVLVVFKRYFLESRIYKSVPMHRFLYLIKIRRWMNVFKIMLYKDVLLLLWYLTIIGGIIKTYSYKLVPYIAAENPNISPKEALLLSKRMMKGHKWEAFVLQFSFLPWILLEIATCGISSIFYSNAYREATISEYYAMLRRLAKEKQIPGVELLNDTYLFEKADAALLKEKYADIADILDDIDTTVEPAASNAFSRFVKKNFGVIAVYDEKERVYEEIQANKDRLSDYTQILDGNMYPSRLFPLPSKDRVREMSSVHANRNYQLTSIVLMFFFMCFVGWAWEVSLHLVTNGEFVNRGVLHGPWLPIYGAGCVLILVLLKKFRVNPLAEFIAAVILCGTLEYFSGYLLEITHDGQKWWDYSGYFINIHGRVCAEGLLVFGLGGLAFVYVIAPFLDNMFRRISFKKAVIACAVLIICIGADQLYSLKYPNMGPGVTDYGDEEDTTDTDEKSEIEKTVKEALENA